jgi:hypothetical protein
MSGGSFDAVISNGMATIQSSSAAAGRSVDRLGDGFGRLGEQGNRQFKRIGEAISKMGGPLGEIGGKFFGAAGMEGGLAQLGLAAAAAGIAFKSFTAVLDAAEARAKAYTDALLGMRAAMKQASAEREGLAAGASDLGKTVALAENVMGRGATAQAKEIAATYQIDQQDVLRGMAAAGGIPKQMRVQILEIAAQAAATGEITMAEAVSKLRDTDTRAKILSASTRKADAGFATASDTQAQAAALVQVQRGGVGSEAVSEAMDTVINAPGPAGAQARRITTAENRETGARLGLYVRGDTAAAIEKRADATVATATDPEQRALDEWLKTEDEKIAVLKTQADAYAKLSQESASLLHKAFYALKARSAGGEVSDEHRAAMRALRDPTTIRGTGAR